MTTEQKFRAAVNVIRSLPKNGSYQPSNELMLRFYAYFKQATQGPCEGARPAFWDVVGRAKYDAWKGLGNMPKQEAMGLYVDELHRIVETMSYTDKVANFLEAPMSELETVSMADIELIAGDVMERVRSQSNSPVGSRETSPTRLQSSLGTTPSMSPTPPEDSDHSDEEYTDTVEVSEIRKPLMQNGHPEPSIQPTTNGYGYTSSTAHKSRAKSKASPAPQVDISQEVARTVGSLKADLDRLSNRVNILENVVKATKSANRKKAAIMGLSPPLFAFMVAWPVVVAIVANRLARRGRT